MSQFLSRARDLLTGIASRSKSRRFYLILLKNSEVRWNCVNATSRGFTEALAGLREAAGKSLIVEALTILHRRIVARRNQAKNRALLLSDGLASPYPAENLSNTMARLRRAVQKIAWNGTSVAWIAPVPKRGLKKFTAYLLRGLDVTPFEL